MIEVVGYIVVGYFGLLTLNIIAIAIDQLIWKIHKILTPKENEEIEKAIDDLCSKINDHTFDVYNLINLAELSSNITNIFSSIAVISGWDWYNNTTEYIGSVKFLSEFEDRIEGLDSRSMNAMYKFKKSQEKFVSEYKRDYPRTIKVLKLFSI